MKEDEILELFAGVKSGRVSEQEALKYLKNYPYEDVGCAKRHKPPNDAFKFRVF